MLLFVAFFTLHASLFTLMAQEDPEYRMEVGAGIGTSTYLGDFNGNLLKNIQPMGSLVAKYRMNPRMSMGVLMSFGKLKGSAADVSTWYPVHQEPPYTFSYQLTDVGLRYEYNFWAYGTGREYRGARRIAPFLTGGMGVTYVNAHGTVLTLNIMLGAGVKYKVADRLNLTAEWNMHFSGNDNLDGAVDPYGIKSTGIFKNTDCYSMLRLALTYDIWAKCKTCNNDRD
jgi:hypothetical protein